MSKITHRDIRLCTADEIRTLHNVLDNQAESLWDDIDAQGVLDMHWAAADAGWDGWQAFLEEEPRVARKAYDAIRAAVAARLDDSNERIRRFVVTVAAIVDGQHEPKDIEAAIADVLRRHAQGVLVPAGGVLFLDFGRVSAVEQAKP